MSETIIACLTPPGAAAVATIGVHGPDAWTVCSSLFVGHVSSMPRELEAVPPERFWFGRFGAELKDEVVLAVKRAQPAPWIEIHCHGGREVVTMIVETLTARGLKHCAWADFLCRTSTSTLEAEAAIALAHAPTARTAGILLDQLRGAFAGAVSETESALQRSDPTTARCLLDALERNAPVGRHLTTPWRVVVAGAPNVGKSSLVNALAGYQRCIVAETPGTTRDVVTTTIAIDGWPIELADTAGQRASTETIEEMGIALARDTLQRAEFCLWVVDASRAPVWPEGVRVPVLFVVNKMDLPQAWDLSSARDEVQVSARTGQGIGELCDALARRLVPEPPPAGAAVPFTEECRRRMEELRRACEATSRSR